MSSDADLADLVRFLSIERLATFQAITGATGEAISLHQQTMRLGSQLMLVTAVIEVALRNAVYEKLESRYGPDWLVASPPVVSWVSSESNKIKQAIKSARREKYAKMTQAQKRHLDKLAFPAGRPPPTGRLDYCQTQLKCEPLRASARKVNLGHSISSWRRAHARRGVAV